MIIQTEQNLKKMEENIILKELPNKSDNNFFCYGLFIYGFDIHKVILLNDSKNNKKGTLKGIGTTYRALNDASYFIDELHEDYLEIFSDKLKSLSKEDGSKYFSEQHVQKILEMETVADLNRTEKNRIYIRTLVWAWLSKAGLYITDATFVGYAETNSAHHLNKYVFLINSYLLQIDHLHMIKIDKGYSGSEFFHKNFEPSDKHVKFITIKNIDMCSKYMYAGYNDVYLSLFQETLTKFYLGLRDDVFNRKNKAARIVANAFDDAKKLKNM